MSFLENAISSIQIGIEDYILSKEDSKRASSAIRNIVAGILLLYKEKLCRLSPEYDKELLIKQDVSFTQEDGELVIKGKGKKTVNVVEIEKRFKDLGVSVDWPTFKKINQLRNDLEHYYTTNSTDAIREIIAKSFVLIRDFMVNELDLGPKEELGEDCWFEFINVHDVYQKEEDDCQTALSKVDWQYDVVERAIKRFRCSHCQSTLIFPNDPDDFYLNVELRCKSCDSDFLVQDILEASIDNYLSASSARAEMNGGEPLYDRCLECDKHTFVFTEGCCVSCSYEMEYTECWRCHEVLRLEDQFLEGLCGSCQHTWNRMSRE